MTRPVAAFGTVSGDVRSQRGLAREHESVIQNLLAGEGEIEPRIEAAAVKLGVSRRQIYTWIGRYREAPPTSALLDKRS